jgi:hypothetical protein
MYGTNGGCNVSEYHKIQTVWLRDPATKHKTLLEGQWATPEFECLKDAGWMFTEKVDGTNVRIIVTRGMGGGAVTLQGKTDESQLPSKLVNMLRELFPPEKLYAQFPDGAVLYGEGYGHGIQKAGPLYASVQTFVLFDVKVGEWWLQRQDVEDVARVLNLAVVPLVGIGTLHDMVRIVRAGFKSRWSVDEEDFAAEGIVARPLVELCDRAGNRIITKLKRKDFAR